MEEIFHVQDFQNDQRITKESIKTTFDGQITIFLCEIQDAHQNDEKVHTLPPQGHYVFFSLF